ncbi:MAG: hypothetical protein GF350_09260 [Chitinivibrionales bacterium]|nr:hypothetical protein [Chitinivibrionales bacterium]
MKDRWRNSVKTILGPVKFSPGTDKLLEVIEKMARCFESTVYLMHCENLLQEPADFSAGPREVRDRVAQELKGELHEIHHKGEELRAAGITTISLLVDGDVVDTIIKQANKIKADMIIMGARNRSLISEMIEGNIGINVLRKAPCPVLFVKP